MMRVNLWAVTEVMAAVLPGMVERGRGAVVNIGSASSEAIPSFPFYTMYAATKRYVAQFSRSLHVEYASKGIHVQYQAPFFVSTRMVAKFTEAGWLSPFAVSADDYACAAVGWIGHGGALCVPNLSHQLTWCVAAVVPNSALDWLLLRTNAWSRGLCLSKSERRRLSGTTLGLVAHGLNLNLVGRDPNNLAEISDMIRSRHRAVQIKTVVFDLYLVLTPHGEEPLRD
uniref:Very-long-chain 3-oxoacyl-CoA reductase n=1 Tax=Leersia perrieri TaxID=77586 RepID=A0A0D9WPI5_9ORYZ